MQIPYKDLFQNLKLKMEELEDSLTEALRYKEAVEAAGFDIWENNFVTGDTYGTNRQLFINLGYPEEELPQSTAETFDKIHPEDLQKALQKVQEHVDGKSERYASEMRIKAKDGTWVWTGSYGRVIERDDQGGVTRIIGVSFDIDQRRIMEETMKEMAFTDALTGIGNRRMLMEAASHEVERGLRYKHPMALLLIDLDNFKHINDTYGHLVGDDILIQFAKCLEHQIRTTDIKTRYGGDEFVVVLVEANEQDALDTAIRLQHAVSQKDFNIPEVLTISIGITTLNPTDTLIEMVKRSDQALYKAKKTGKNKTVVI